MIFGQACSTIFYIPNTETAILWKYRDTEPTGSTLLYSKKQLVPSGGIQLIIRSYPAFGIDD